MEKQITDYAYWTTGERWHIASNPPERKGVYIVIILTRVWNGNEIVQGIEPSSREDHFDDRANSYFKMPGGRWCEEVRRVWNGERWSGFEETVLYWTEMPAPPFKKGMEMPDVAWIDSKQEKMGCLNCYVSLKYFGTCICSHENEAYMKRHPSERPEWCLLDPKV